MALQITFDDGRGHSDLAAYAKIAAVQTNFVNGTVRVELGIYASTSARKTRGVQPTGVVMFETAIASVSPKGDPMRLELYDWLKKRVPVKNTNEIDFRQAKDC